MRWAIGVALFALGASAQIEGDSLLAQGGVLYEKGRYEEALTLYREAARKGFQAPIAWFNAGNCLARLDRRGEAAAAWGRALEWAPGFWRARRNLASLAEENGDWAEAARHWRLIAVQRPQDPLPHLRLGWIALDAGDPAEALRWFMEAQAAEMSGIEAWLGSAEALLVLGDSVAARQQLSEPALPDPGSPGERTVLADLLERTGAMMEARTAWELVVAEDPSRQDAWIRLARWHQLRGQDAAAVIVIRQAIREAGTGTSLVESLRSAARRAGDSVAEAEAKRLAGSASP